MWKVGFCVELIVEGRRWWTPTALKVTPDLLCPVTVAPAKFIYVLFTQPCHLPVPSLVLNPFTHPIAWGDAARGVQGHALCFPSGVVLDHLSCFQPFSGSNVLLCSSLGYGWQIEQLLCCRGMYQLVLWGRRVCIKLQMISPDQEAGGRTSVSFPCSWPQACLHCSLNVFWLSPAALSLGHHLGR